MTIIILIGAFALVIAIIVAISKSASASSKTSFLNQIGILTDELDRQKRENIAIRSEIKRINSQDNLFFASMIRVASKQDPVEIARETTALVANFLNAPEVAIFMRDEKGKRLNIMAQHGLNENWLPKLVYEKGEGKVGTTLEKRIPLSPREFEMLRIKEPFPIFDPTFCQPIVYQQDIYGVIAIVRNSEFEERERSMLGVVASITGIALNNTLSFASLRDLASMDPLTKLYNIGHFRDRLAEELNRARRFQHDLSISILDLDNFKYYNDTYGHQSGDQLLMQLAQQMTKHFRDTDVVGRYGGDEFIIMFLETKKPEAAKTLSILLNELSLRDFARGQEERRITFSAGVSSYPEDGSNPGELIKCADKALYEAKGAGRNTVRMHFHQLEKI
ncbi:MAG TPA: sensor domain-containing diguanylate cyclase [bacterium]